MHRHLSMNTWQYPRRFFSSRANELLKGSVVSASRALDTGEVTAVDLLDASLTRSAECQDRFNCFVGDLWNETARKAAEASDERRANGEARGPIDGIPFAVKDNFCVQGMATGAASSILSGWTAPYSANVVDSLEGAGCVMVGSTNMDEFGMGSTSQYSPFGAVKSPYSKDLSAGGSSGGSSCLVSAGGAFGALGSDTGGSVRQPASFCGIVGLKPSYGRLSRHGMIAHASSLDVPGVFGRSVSDVSLFLDGLTHASSHPLSSINQTDPTTASVDSVERYFELTQDVDLKGVKVGIPKELNVEGLHESALSFWKEAMDFFKDAGADVVEVSIPSIPHSLAAYYIVSSAEAASNLARYDGLRYGTQERGASLEEVIEATRSMGFGDEVKRRILCGNYVLSASAFHAYYEQAMRLRAQLRREFNESFKSVDVLLTPTTPTPPVPLSPVESTKPTDLYINDIMTVPVSLAGLPAISVPVGLTKVRTSSETIQAPMGMQIIGRPLEEGMVLRAGAALENRAGFDLPHFF